MEEKIIQLISNPQLGTARDTTVPSGGTVFVRLSSGQTVNARAIAPINSPRVMVAFSEQDNIYYAVPESLAREINRETSELSRSKPQPEPVIEEGFFIVITDDRQIYSSVRTDISFRISPANGTRVFTIGQENTEVRKIVLDDRPIAQIDLSFRNNDRQASSSFIELRTIIVRNVDQFLDWNISTGIDQKLQLIQLSNRDETIAAFKEYFELVTGFQEPQRVYSGTPEQTYIYNTNQGQESVTINRVFTDILDGTFVAGTIIDFQPFAFSVDEETLAFGNCLEPAMWVPDPLGIVKPVPGTGHYRTTSLLQDEMETRVQAIDTVSNSGNTYSINDDLQSLVQFNILYNNNTDPAGGGNYGFETTSSQVDTYQESASTNEAGALIDWDPENVSMKSGTYSLSIDRVLTKSYVKRKEVVYTVIGGGAGTTFVSQQRTFFISTEWELNITESQACNVTASFDFGTLSIPIRHIFSTNFTSSLSFPTTETVIENTPLITPNTKAPSFNALPDRLLAQRETVTGTQTANCDFQATKIYTTNKAQMLVNRVSLSCTLNLESVVKFAVGIGRVITSLRVNQTADFTQFVAPGLIGYTTFLPDIIPAEPWPDDFGGYETLDSTILFFRQLREYTDFQATEVIEEETRQIEFLDTFRRTTKSFSGYALENALIWHDSLDGSTINIRSDNTMFFRTSKSQTNEIGSTITLEEFTATDSKTEMSYLSGFPSSFTEEVTTQWNGSSFDFSFVNTISATTARKSILDYIGEDFLVYNPNNNRLHVAVLQSVVQGTDTATFEIITSVELQSGTFFDENNNRAIAVTKINLASLFLCPGSVRSNIQRDIAINGKSLFLTYRENDDADPTNDEVGFVHEFTIQDDGNITFEKEIQAKITTELESFLDPKRDGFNRQYVNKIN